MKVQPWRVAYAPLNLHKQSKPMAMRASSMNDSTGGYDPSKELREVAISQR